MNVAALIQLLRLSGMIRDYSHNVDFNASCLKSMTFAFVSHQMSRLRLITFDVTNTLLRLRGSPGREYANVAKMFGVNIGHDELDRVYLDVWAEKKSEHPIYGLSEGLTTKQWWADFVRRVFCRAGYTGSPVILEVVAEKLHDKFSEGKNWETMPFASDVLKVGI